MRVFGRWTDWWWQVNIETENHPLLIPTLSPPTLAPTNPWLLLQLWAPQKLCLHWATFQVHTPFPGTSSWLWSWWNHPTVSGCLLRCQGVRLFPFIDWHGWRHYWVCGGGRVGECSVCGYVNKHMVYVYGKGVTGVSSSRDNLFKFWHPLKVLLWWGIWIEQWQTR